LQLLAEFKVPAGRRNKVSEFLTSGGFLAEPPPLERVSQRVRECLGAGVNGLTVEYFAMLFVQSVS
jgi:hypothetical protein